MSVFATPAAEDSASNAIHVRPLQSGDRAEVAEGILSAPDLHDLTTGFELPWGQDQVDEYLERTLAAHRAGTRLTYGVLSQQRMVGVAELFELRAIHRTARVGIQIWSPADRGCSYGTQAMNAAIAIAFDRLALNRLWATVLATNGPSRALATKCHFRHEGVLRDHAFVRGTACDVHVFGLLANERV